MNAKLALRAGMGVATAVLVGVGAPLAFADGADTAPVGDTNISIPTLPTPTASPSKPTPAPAPTASDQSSDCVAQFKSPARGDGKVLPGQAMSNAIAASKRTARFEQWKQEHPELAKKLAQQRARVHARHAEKGNGMERHGKAHCKSAKQVAGKSAQSRPATPKGRDVVKPNCKVELPKRASATRSKAVAGDTSSFHPTGTKQ